MSNLCPLQWGCRVLTSTTISRRERSLLGLLMLPLFVLLPRDPEDGAPTLSLSASCAPPLPAHKSRLSADFSTSSGLSTHPSIEPPDGPLRLNSSPCFKCNKTK